MSYRNQSQWSVQPNKMSNRISKGWIYAYPMPQHQVLSQLYTPSVCTDASWNTGWRRHTGTSSPQLYDGKALIAFLPGPMGVTSKPPEFPECRKVFVIHGESLTLPDFILTCLKVGAAMARKKRDLVIRWLVFWVCWCVLHQEGREVRDSSITRSTIPWVMPM